MAQTPDVTPLGLNKWDENTSMTYEQFTEDNRITDEALRSLNANLSKFGSTLTYTVDIANLQSTIDSLPKLLNRDVTISVNAGTYNGQIAIERFYGPGRITITGALESGTSHRVTNFLIYRCNCAQVFVKGFYAIATSGNVFYISECGCANVTVADCTATPGVNATASFYGIHCNASCPVYVWNCIIGNKGQAIRAIRGKVIVYELSGSDNLIVYYAASGGAIHLESAGIAIGSTLKAVGSGGLIVNSGGGTIGA